MAALLCAEQRARAAYLEVAHCNAEAGVELRELAYGLEPLFGYLAEHLVPPEGQVRARPARAAPNASANLVQLREAELVGVLDYEGVNVGYIYARLDYRRTHKYLYAALGHVLHDAAELLGVHLAVGHGDDCAVHELGYFHRRALYVVHAVVQIIDLAAPVQFAAHGVGQDAPVVLHNEGLHRQTFHRRLLYRGHVAYTAERHIQRSRYRRRREGQHVYLTAELLDMFLVGHSEALLLVDDKQAQVLESDVLLQKAVRAYDQVAPAVGHVGERLFYLRRRPEAAEHLYVNRVTCEALHRRLIMLLGQDGGRHEYGRLLPVEDTLHHGAQGDLGFAVAHVAAKQAVHRHGLLHVGLYLLHAAELVGGLLVGEALLKLSLPGRIRRKGVTLAAGALGIERYELAGQLFRRGLCPGLCALPLRAAHLGKAHRPVLARAYVFAHQIQLRRGNVQHVAAGIAYLDIVLLHAVDRHAHNARKTAYAVVLVYDEVADGQVGIRAYALCVRQLAFCLALRLSEAAAGYLRVREHREAYSRVLEPGRQASGRHDALTGLRQGAEIFREQAFHRVPVQKLRQQLCTAHVARKHCNGEAALQIAGDVLRRLRGAAAVAWQLLCAHYIDAPRLDGIASGGEGVGHIQRHGSQAAHGGVEGDEVVVGFGYELCGACEACDVLCDAFYVRPRVLAEPGRLVHDDERAGGYVVYGSRGVAVDERGVAVRSGQFRAGEQPVGVLAQHGGQGGTSLARAPLHCPVRQPDQLVRQGVRTALCKRGQHLGGRDHGALVYALRAALSARVEEAHGVYLVAPELNAYRLAVSRREEVQYAATARKLSRSLYLNGPRISAAQKSVLNVLGRRLALHIYLKHRPAEHLRRHGALKKPLRSHDCNACAVHQGGQGVDAPLLRAAAHGVRAVEGVVAPGEKAAGLAGQGGYVSSQG